MSDRKSVVIIKEKDGSENRSPEMSLVEAWESYHRLKSAFGRDVDVRLEDVK